MKHSVISWDCSYRNFFHLVEALREQDYDSEEYELIFVEQRSKADSDAFNHRLGLRSLGETIADAQPHIQATVVYLDEAESTYHLGRAVNAGLERAQGDIVSVMDGDQLVRPSFLRALDAAHAEGPSVLNILRMMARHPVGARTDDWTSGVFDFAACLEACAPVPEPLPTTVENKGPMVSAPKWAWSEIGGYDPSDIWSTSLSAAHRDANARLEIALGSASRAVSDEFAVHPYHPAGTDYASLDSARMQVLQLRLIKWSTDRNDCRWSAREQVAERMLTNNAPLVNRLRGATDGGISSLVHKSVRLGLIYKKVAWRLLGLP